MLVVILVYVVLNNYALDNGMILYDVKNIIIVRLWTYFLIDCGLWKFNGLPGLIMKAADSNDEYVFTLTSMNQKQEDIVRYPKIEKIVSREQYRKMEKNAHDDPILTSDGADGYRLIYDESRSLASKEVFSSGHFLYP